MSSKVKIIVGKGGNRKSFTIPRILLEHVSESLKNMCSDNKQLIRLPDDDPEDFGTLITYIKTERMELSSLKKAVELYSLCDKYSISEAKLPCFIYLMRLLNPDTIGKILELAKELNVNSLSSICWSFIMSNTDEVLNSASFRNLKKETVSDIIRQDFINTVTDEDESKSEESSSEKEPSSLEEKFTQLRFENLLEIIAKEINRMLSSVKEITIYKAVVEWGKEELNRKKRKGEESSLREILKPLIRHIRFFRMSRSEITELLWEDEILTEEEKCQILAAKRNGRASQLTSHFLNFSTQQRQRLQLPILCCNNEANSKSHILKEVLRAKSHNLYLFGLILHRSCSDLQGCRIEIRNITTQKKIQMTQKILPLGNSFGVTFGENALFIVKNEVFEIVLQTDNDKLLPCCRNECGTSDLLERVPYLGEIVGHFVGIAAIPITP